MAISVERTREIMEPYSQSHDPSYIAEDAVYTIMENGQEAEGREAIAELLNFFYNQAFAAHTELANFFVAEGKAVIEGWFVGTHKGEVAGIPPTNKEVRAPICVVYDVEDDGIKKARIYLPGLAQQLLDE
jgi:predicted ester cyclase